MIGSAGAWLAGPVAGVVAALVGAAFGVLLSRAVGGWFRATDDAPPEPRTTTLLAVAAAFGSALLWWWEVGQAGQLPPALRAEALADGRGELAVRCLAHLVLFWLLAAATWIDIRQRVIPDWITLPGALAGLACAWAAPRSLLPVSVDVPRSFAAPAIEPDVLAWYGGLGTGGAGPFTAAPCLAGIGMAATMFVLWWAVCTEAPSDDRAPRGLAPRTMLLGLGLVALVSAWWLGTDRFDALQTALVGLVASGGVVWATRAGASHALGREAMGLGDVTLMAMVGAWLGWQACVLTFFLAAFIGLGHGAMQLLRHREHELPFGPSLCLAAALVVVTWRAIWQASAVHFAAPGQLMLVVAAVVVMTAITLFVWRSLRGGA